jgi:hypothetical protein
MITEYAENPRFFCYFIGRIHTMQKMTPQKRKAAFIKLWNFSDNQLNADFYFSFLRLCFPEYYERAAA